MIKELVHERSGEEYMAITKILRRSTRIDQLIRYVTQNGKTDDARFVVTQNCVMENAAIQMQHTKALFDQHGGTQAFHIIQSFSPDEVTPELALQIAQEFAEEHLTEYQVVIGTHCDRKHIHNHIVFNAVSFVTGKKYHSTPQTYYGQIRAISDRLCREHGLSVIMNGEEKHKGMSYAEWKAMQDGGLSLRQIVERDVREVLSYALVYGEFLAFMEDKGYEIKHGKYLSFRPYGYERFIRPKMDGITLSEDGVRSYIEGALVDPDAQVLVPRPFVPYCKPMIGVIGIYRHYLYILGCVEKNRAMPKQSAMLRTELKKFEHYKEQHRYLSRNDIVYESELQERITNLESQLEMLTKKRTILNTQKKRNAKLYTAIATVEHFSPGAELIMEGSVGTNKEKQVLQEAYILLEKTDTDAVRRERNKLYQEIAEINMEMREKRKELKVCKTILNTVPELGQRLEELNTLSDKRGQPEFGPML